MGVEGAAASEVAEALTRLAIPEVEKRVAPLAELEALGLPGGLEAEAVPILAFEARELRIREMVSDHPCLPSPEAFAATAVASLAASPVGGR